MHTFCLESQKGYSTLGDCERFGALLFCILSSEFADGWDLWVFVAPIYMTLIVFGAKICPFL